MPRDALRSALPVMATIALQVVSVGAAEIGAGTSYPITLLGTMGARTAALGGAAVSLASAQDPLSSVINPAAGSVLGESGGSAAKAWFRKVSVTMGAQARPTETQAFGQHGYTGLACYVRPVGITTYASGFRVDGIERTDKDGNLLGYLESFEYMAGLALSMDLARFFPDQTGPLHAGIGINVLQQSTRESLSGSAIFAPATTVSVSYGLLYFPRVFRSERRQLILGLSHLRVKPSLQPFDTLSRVRTKVRTYTREDELPSKVLLGVALRQRSLNREVTLALDGGLEQGAKVLRPALETRLGASPSIAARAGYLVPVQRGRGVYYDSSPLNFDRLSLGLGVGLPIRGTTLFIDYAYLPSTGDLAIGDQHRLSLTTGWLEGGD